VLVEGTGKIDS